MIYCKLSISLEAVAISAMELVSLYALKFCEHTQILKNMNTYFIDHCIMK
jgi:hypothetical protein